MFTVTVQGALAAASEAVKKYLMVYLINMAYVTVAFNCVGSRIIAYSAVKYWITWKVIRYNDRWM